MTDSLINLFTYAFDLFIILAFYNNTLIHRKKMCRLLRSTAPFA